MLDNYETAESNPEKLGLKILENINIAGPYEFDQAVIFERESDGKKFWAYDSGCSCPNPFESFRSIEDLNQLPDTAEDLKSSIEHCGVANRRTILRSAGFV